MRGFCGLVLLSLVLIWGCGSKPPETTAGKPPAVQAPLDPWVLTCLDPKAEEPALLWNGLIGLRIGRDGLGVGKEPSFFMIDEYEKTGEEKIRGMPNPVRLVVTEGAHALNSPEGMSHYSQRLDMRTGILVTEWDASTQPGDVHVKVETAIHPDERIVAVRYTAVPSRDADLRFSFSDNGLKAEKMQAFGFYHGLGPSAVRWSVRQSAPGALPTGDDTKKVELFVREATWSFGSASGRDEAPKPISFGAVADASAKKWAERWRTDIEIDGPVADQQAVRSFMFYLRSAIYPKGEMSISPFGLSNQMYNGHVFWDADIWVFPALALIDPPAAQAISNYRLSKAAAAQANFSKWLRASRPTAHGAMGGVDETRPLAGQKFPWESSVSGRETAPGPSRFEDHITGSVAFALEQAVSLKLISPMNPDEPARLPGYFYGLRYEEGRNGREIRDVMSPDENHTGDNDLYTNLLAEWCSAGGKWPAKPTYKLPHDDKTFLTYDNDQLRGYKQAAAVLSIYPLQYPPAEAQAKAMMDRLSDKVIKNGPAMTDSVHSIIWSRLGEKDKAYETWQKSWVPFTTSPFLLFSEKRLRPTTYFTTGAGGSLQSVLFGFLGFRIDWKQEPGAAWTTQLRRDAWLSIKPNLPKTWKSVKFKNFTVLGRPYTLTVTPAAARVTPGE
ncbi:glycosyl hydrolase family 65 protein [Fimbriimonas ginsengisoli]|uniref:glycosyl hydrolase family 65 protein n=1 Tax=Fimbriimonas ginsengisoli TaxID=1005039 RepID=UPI0011852E5D|nr:glycosyl hydrolase family 65 protein [Fimbriimonas ginsengisoli]